MCSIVRIKSISLCPPAKCDALLSIRVYVQSNSRVERNVQCVNCCRNSPSTEDFDRTAGDLVEVKMSSTFDLPTAQRIHPARRGVPVSKRLWILGMGNSATDVPKDGRFCFKCDNQEEVKMLKVCDRLNWKRVVSGEECWQCNGIPLVWSEDFMLKGCALRCTCSWSVV